MSTEIPGTKPTFEIESDEYLAESNIDYYECRRKIAEHLDDEAMDFLYRCLRTTAGGGISEPLAMLGAYGSHAYVLDYAEKDTLVTHEHIQQTVTDYTGAFLVDAVDAVNATIDTVGTSVGQLHPAAAADKARELMAENFANQQYDAANDYDIAQLFSCYFLTLLSGDSSVYEELYARAKSMFDDMDGMRINSRIKSFIRDNPEKLAIVTRVYNDAAHDMFNSYNLYHVSELLTDATREIIAKDQMKHYRNTMLTFAKQVTFDPVIRHQLAEAELSAIPQPEMKPEVTLDWEILPPGQLEEFAKEIVEVAQNSGEHTNPSIDLRRLQILENIRHQHGVNVSYYAKGIRKTRRVIREGGTEQPDEYILLVLQRVDDDGQLTGEDVIAESPISGPNALYVQRQDVNGWDWRELMAYPKPDTRDMGARSMKHVAPAGHDLIAWMTEKVAVLLDSSPNEFLHGEFKGVDTAGKPRLRIPQRVLTVILTEHELLE